MLFTIAGTNHFAVISGFSFLSMKGSGKISIVERNELLD